MGIDYAARLGPFLECTTILAEVQETRNGCSKCKQQMYDSRTKFCSTCGTAIGDYTVSVIKSSVDPGQIREEINETLFFANHAGLAYEFQRQHPDIHIWLINQKAEGYFNQDIYEYETDGITYLDEINPRKEMEAFERQYAKEIAILRRHYAEQVKVRWGIVNTAH